LLREKSAKGDPDELVPEKVPEICAKAAPENKDANVKPNSSVFILKFPSPHANTIRIRNVL
jgi:hypothetical protein